MTPTAIPAFAPVLRGEYTGEAGAVLAVQGGNWFIIVNSLAQTTAFCVDRIKFPVPSEYSGKYDSIHTRMMGYARA